MVKMEGRKEGREEGRKGRREEGRKEGRKGGRKGGREYLCVLSNLRKFGENDYDCDFYLTLLF